jgi:hypothetical protein
MFLYPRSKDRPFHLGPLPLESFPRDAGVVALEARRAAIPIAPGAVRRPLDVLSRAADRYRELFAKFADGMPASAQAPVPDDLERRSADLKGGAYFMDASGAGICRIPENAWLAGAAPLPRRSRRTTEAPPRPPGRRGRISERRQRPELTILPLQSRPNASSFWIILLLSVGALEHGMIKQIAAPV